MRWRLLGLRLGSAASSPTWDLRARMLTPIYSTPVYSRGGPDSKKLGLIHLGSTLQGSLKDTTPTTGTKGSFFSHQTGNKNLPVKKLALTERRCFGHTLHCEMGPHRPGEKSSPLTRALSNQRAFCTARSHASLPGADEASAALAALGQSCSGAQGWDDLVQAAFFTHPLLKQPLFLASAQTVGPGCLNQDCPFPHALEKAGKSSLCSRQTARVHSDPFLKVSQESQGFWE